MGSVMLATANKTKLLNERYNKQGRIGAGTFGTVYEATDCILSQKCALKKLTSAKKDSVGLSQMVYSEIMYLFDLNHANIVKLLDVFRIENKIFLVLELFKTDLGEFLADESLSLSLSAVKYLARGILLGLEYLHSTGLVHRDIKPNNVLLGEKGEIKICDFGLTRQYENRDIKLTSAIVSLWYRSPELLYGVTKYNGCVDIWSFGCIISELILREAIFQGRSDLHQLRIIYEKRGTPNEETWPGFNKLNEFLKCVYIPEPPLETLFENDSAKALLSILSPSSQATSLHFIQFCLTLCPDKRPSAKELLGHNFLSLFADDHVMSMQEFSALVPVVPLSKRPRTQSYSEEFRSLRFNKRLNFEY